jgi:membrane peptidoglycan carboxypeptidase
MNSDGEMLPGQAQECNQAIDPEVAATAAFALQGAMRGYGGNPKDGTPMMGKTGTTDDFNQTWLMSSSSSVTTAVWFGNIVNKFPISKYPGGLNNRHNIAKPINAATNAVYPGGAFDDPAPRLVNGAGITLPGFAGGTVENAKGIIEGIKLVYADGGQVDSDQPAGVVVNTDPAEGAVMARGQTVTVYTSNGALKSMPDVVSGGLTFDAASSQLVGAGFTNVTKTCVVLSSPTDPQMGKVTSSNPAIGAVVRVADPVVLGVGAASRASC